MPAATVPIFKEFVAPASPFSPLGMTKFRVCKGALPTSVTPGIGPEATVPI
jgi:hypothetical protein